MHMLAYTNMCACSFHWILLIIEVDEGKIQVLDSLLKEIKEYHNVKLMLDRQFQSLSHYVGLFSSFSDIN